MAKHSTKKREAAMHGVVRWYQDSEPSTSVAGEVDDRDKLWLAPTGNIVKMLLSVGPATWLRIDPQAAQAAAQAAATSASNAHDAADAAQATATAALPSANVVLGGVANAVPRANGTGGKTLKASSLLIDDAGVASGITFADPTTAQQPATRAYVLANAGGGGGGGLTARVALVDALPAYVKSGSAGAEVLTFTGALTGASFGGVTPANGEKVLVAYNEKSTPDAGLFVHTIVSGNSVLTRDPTLNTSALLGSSAIRVTEGPYAGRTFQCAQTVAQISAVGTTPICWMLSGPIPPDHGFEFSNHYTQNGPNLVTNPNTTNPGIDGEQYTSTGTGSAVAVNIDATRNGEGVLGEQVLHTTVLANATANVVAYLTPLSAFIRQYVRYDVDFSTANTDPAGTTYSIAIGANVLDVNYTMALVVAAAADGATLQLTQNVAAVAQPTIALGTLTLKQPYTLTLEKRPLQRTFDVYFDGVYKGTTAACAPYLQFLKRVAKTNTGGGDATLRFDYTRLRYYDPKSSSKRTALVPLANTARLNFFGDSITKGVPGNASIFDGYRKGLYDAAVTAGFTSLAVIGSIDEGVTAYAPTRLHDGIPSTAYTDRLAAAAGLFGTSPTSLGSLGVVDIQVHNMGTNPETPPGGSAGYQQVGNKGYAWFDTLLTAQPDVRIVYVYTSTGAGVAALVRNYETALVQQLRARGAKIWTCLPSGVTTGDGTHPTDPAGYAQMVAAIQPAFLAALKGLPPGDY